MGIARWRIKLIEVGFLFIFESIFQEVPGILPEPADPAADIFIINHEVSAGGNLLFSCQKPLRYTTLFKKRIQTAVCRLPGLPVVSAEGKKLSFILHGKGRAVIVSSA